MLMMHLLHRKEGSIIASYIFLCCYYCYSWEGMSISVCCTMLLGCVHTTGYFWLTRLEKDKVFESLGGFSGMRCDVVVIIIIAMNSLLH